jgi:hypothetical protein
MRHSNNSNEYANKSTFRNPMNCLSLAGGRAELQSGDRTRVGQVDGNRSINLKEAREMLTRDRFIVGLKISPAVIDNSPAGTLIRRPLSDESETQT